VRSRVNYGILATFAAGILRAERAEQLLDEGDMAGAETWHRTRSSGVGYIIGVADALSTTQPDKVCIPVLFKTEQRFAEQTCLFCAGRKAGGLHDAGARAALSCSRR
jgi:hypothetical protein